MYHQKSLVYISLSWRKKQVIYISGIKQLSLN